MASAHTPSSPSLRALAPASTNSTVTQKAENGEKSIRFLELPAEIRNQIYEYDICQPGFPILCLLNHEIRSEILPLVSRHLLVDIDMNSRDSFQYWIDRWMPAVARYFRFIRLSNYHHIRSQYPRRQHRRCCTGSISIDLRDNKQLVTYRKTSTATLALAWMR
jgi:hypothetical protein